MRFELGEIAFGVVAFEVAFEVAFAVVAFALAAAFAAAANTPRPLLLFRAESPCLLPPVLTLRSKSSGEWSSNANFGLERCRYYYLQRARLPRQFLYFHSYYLFWFFKIFLPKVSNPI
jgi:hypothetical protein